MKNVFVVIEKCSYYEGGASHSLVSVWTCTSMEVAEKLRLKVERDYVESFYAELDEKKEDIEERVREVQSSHEWYCFDDEHIEWDIGEREMIGEEDVA